VLPEAHWQERLESGRGGLNCSSIRKLEENFSVRPRRVLLETRPTGGINLDWWECSVSVSSGRWVEAILNCNYLAGG